MTAARMTSARPASIERWLLAFTVIGFVVAVSMFATFIAQHGWALGDYLGAWFGSLPSAQLSADLGLCCLAFVTWAAVDGRRLGVRWWVTIPAICLVGLCFAIPLYLLMRERALAAQADSAPPPPAA